MSATDDVLAAAAEQLRELVAVTEPIAANERAGALRDLLDGPVHDALMRASADGDERVPRALADLARTLREHLPPGIEDGLPTRVRVLVALLRRDALVPAWTLAQDNSSGRVRPSKVAATWAGGTHPATGLPLPTLIEGGHVFAWLPGFRDPRWNVPDDVYDMDRGVTLCHRLDEVTVRDGELWLRGIGYLSELTAGPEDRVELVFTGPDAAEHRVPAARGRRPDLVSPHGPDLTRLAWGGWYAGVPLAPMAGTPGQWRASLEVAVDGVARSAPLGTDRGPFAEPRRSRVVLTGSEGGPVECGSEPDGRLVVRVARP